MLKKLNLKDSKLSIRNKVGILTFCRNDIRNALTGSYLIDDIINTIDFINKSNNISVLIPYSVKISPRNNFKNCSFLSMK